MVFTAGGPAQPSKGGRRPKTLAEQHPSLSGDAVQVIWCERGDSNPHGFTRQILSLVRLPIPPLSRLQPWPVVRIYCKCIDSG